MVSALLTALTDRRLRIRSVDDDGPSGENEHRLRPTSRESLANPYCVRISPHARIRPQAQVSLPRKDD